MLSYENKTFANKDELFTFLRDNKDKLLALKSQEYKKCDSIHFDLPILHKSDLVDKSLFVTKAEETEEGVLNVKAVINTTNVIDSHGDMHAAGIWTKSLKENKRVLLLQEHKNAFDNIIAYADDVKASVENTTFKALGYDLQGNTQALVFNAKIRRDVNAEMYDRYNKKRVTEHSVGMRYVKIDLAINSESEFDKEEKAVWDEYSPMVANTDALEKGYFWVVKEAKFIEGSAVPMGSNPFTPTIQEKTEPSNDTPKTEPLESTQYLEIIKEFTQSIKN